jgi:2-C-methyl-D-erythritol 4-phosphate cytidylyltransferase
LPSTPPLDGPVWALVLAAGRGRRFGGLRPKQFELVAGERVLDRSLATARSVADHVVVVVGGDDAELGDQLVEAGEADASVVGGVERADSVRAGLALVADDAAGVVVHDAARPLASADLYRAVVAAVRAGADAAIPGVAVTDTVKRVVDAGPARGEALVGVVVETLDRSELVAVQTPQAFRADVLRAAHVGSDDATDDAALVEAAGGTVVVVPGEPTNLKITGPQDLVVLEALVGGLSDTDADGR